MTLAELQSKITSWDRKDFDNVSDFLRLNLTLVERDNNYHRTILRYELNNEETVDVVLVRRYGTFCYLNRGGYVFRLNHKTLELLEK